MTPTFYVDGGCNDPTGCRIPSDPARFIAHEDPVADALRRWDHAASVQIGEASMGRLRNLDLMVVPRATWERAMAMLQSDCRHCATSSGADQATRASVERLSHG
jgi:hypothetical protein